MPEQAVSAPAHPGATVIESSTQSRPVPMVTPTDTTGMGETQTRAMRWVDEVAKPAMLRGGDSNPWLLAKNREALDHVFHGAPEPAWLREGEPRSTEQIIAEGRIADQATPPELAAAWAPMAAHEVGHLEAAAKVHGVPPRDAVSLAKFCLEAQLPEGMSHSIMKRVGAHISERGNPTLSESEHAEFREAAVELFGSEAKYIETSTRAIAYLKSLPPSVGDFVGRLADTSIVYDPHILNTLASMATARGIAK